MKPVPFGEAEPYNPEDGCQRTSMAGSDPLFSRASRSYREQL